MLKRFLLQVVLLVAVSCTTAYYPLKEHQAKNVAVNEGSPVRQDILDFVKPYRDSLEHDMLRVIAFSDQEMVKDKPESEMTNFMSDMLLTEGRAYCAEKKIDQPQVAYVNYGGLRASLPQGDINVQKVFELMPFENEMVFLKISGEKFLEFAKIVASRDGDGIGGMTVGIKDKKLSTVKVAGKEFDPKQSYWIVTNDYAATGGDNMTMFLNPEKFVSTGKTVRSVIISYLEKQTREGKHISAKKDGRVYYE